MGTFTGTTPDLDYQYIQNERKVKEMLKQYPGCNKTCQLCDRSDELLTGPFVKYSSSSTIIGLPLYFHRECIEVSHFSYYRLSDNKWVNISEALQHLVTHNQYKCDRC
jgi:hypothetical protein